MREKSYYDLTCVCGKVIAAESHVGVCPDCHREYEVRFIESSKDSKLKDDPR